MTKEELIQKLDTLLYGYDNREKIGSVSGGAITDITKILMGPGPDLAVFILGACFIDAMASFRYGITKEILEDENEMKIGDLEKKYIGYKRSSGRFKDFIMEYLPEIYKSNKERDFYKSLRCGLIHNYTEYGKYGFYSGNENFHHKTIKGKIVITRNEFVEELKKAYKKFIKDIDNSDRN